MWQVRQNELTHYGVPGMKWGVRKDRTSKSERKERKRLTKDLAAANKYMKTRAQMYKKASDDTYAANKQYERALSRPALPWKRAKKEAAISRADANLQKTMTTEQESRWKKERATKIGKEKKEALKSYVDALNKKYGKENVRQLEEKNIRIGKTFFEKNPIVIETLKTGVRTENLPAIGNMVSAKKINEWEKSIREEIAAKKTENLEKNRYA